MKTAKQIKKEARERFNEFWDKELQEIQLLWFSDEGDEFKGVIGNAMNDRAIPNMIKTFLDQTIDTTIKQTLEEVRKVIKITIGNDYHNMGMGSLDYHEKCAVDAFIESFKSRLQQQTKLAKEIEDNNK